MPSHMKMDTTLCSDFCTYYRPGKSEELACQGYVVVQRLMGKGRTLSLARPARVVPASAEQLQGLRDRVCLRCPFREHDCDFIATGGSAPSCGGFLLLSHLVGAGELMLDEIEHDE